MILNRQRRVRVSREPLARFLEQVRRVLRVPTGAIAVCLVEDAEMARLNKTYRGQRGSTDVLSFPAENKGPRGGSRAAKPPKPATADFLGDIAISPVVAQRNARRHGRTLPAELRILILHGVLHLLGYDHEADHGEMQRKENRLRRQLGLEP